LSPVKVVESCSDRRYGAGRVTVKPKAEFAYRAPAAALGDDVGAAIEALAVAVGVGVDEGLGLVAAPVGEAED